MLIFCNFGLVVFLNKTLKILRSVKIWTSWRGNGVGNGILRKNLMNFGKVF